MQPTPQQNLRTPQMDAEQITVNLTLTQSELAMWELKIKTTEHRGKRYRQLVDLVGRRVLAVAGKVEPDDQKTLATFLTADKTLEDAELQLAELQVARLKAQCAIYVAALEAIDKHQKEKASGIVAPHGGGSKIVVPGV